ncbi:hydantoinase/oxoprolinase family protein [uncultured Desulfovibrio sp.]|uniref:hydantoinase/oxoprolinase family protein n=1 Tax=uncultured Desulfovibrio sp. TaxID=167968 RepID=UPI0026209566|nr:hydantoinase/oxoprolinase family protein [uncultured Desulfovibrio sp.]
MKESTVLGIDAGGTHTDAVLITGKGGRPRLAAWAKVKTRHDDLPASVREVLAALAGELGPTDAALLTGVERVTLGTTLAVNALVQGRADSVALALSAGPGLDPARSGLGEHVCVVPGGLDHRGVEVSPLQTEELARRAARWRDEGVAAVACVGKFSPRNPAHERAMGAAAVKASGLPVTLGHRLSGQLNFPRRVATAYYNAAVQRLHNEFLDAVEAALTGAGIHAVTRLLKADGGVTPTSLSRREPVQSILSGPAASVMGVMALCPETERGCSLLLDMGGTTTDMALFSDGSPVIDREGMLLRGRRTLVRALASTSIGVGGDSLLTVEGVGREARVRTGPLRQGPALAFGGAQATLLDALNALDGEAASGVSADRGNLAASREGMAALAAAHGLEARLLAQKAVDDALARVVQAARELVEAVNARPIYTLAALKAAREARPQRVWLVGGPADCIRQRLGAALGLPVASPPHAAVANAVGAALTLPTAGLEIYADTGRGLLRAPALDLEERIGKGYTLDAAERRARELLAAHLAAEGVPDAAVEVVEADLFATLDDGGYGSRDIRVACQVVPGIAGRVAPA